MTTSKREIPERIKKDMGYLNIEYPAVEPLFSSPPIETAKKEFVKLHHSKLVPEYKDLAQVFVDNINHVSYEQFLISLLKQINLFTKKIGNKPYVLWFTQECWRKINLGCSEQWVISLAFEYSNLPWPQRILKTDELVDFLQNNPTIEDILVLDDASYSGTHLQTEIEALIRSRYKNLDLSKFTLDELCSYKLLDKKNLNLVVPYVTNRAKKTVLDICGGYFGTTTIFNCEIMPIFKELLSPEQLELAKILGLSSLEKTLTYFDHLVPDAMSTHTLLDFRYPTSTYPAPRLANIEEHMLLNGYCLSWGGIQYITEKLKKLKGYDIKEHLSPIVNQEDWNSQCLTVMKDHVNLVPKVIRPYRLHKEKHVEELQYAKENNALGTRNNTPVPDSLSKIGYLLGEPNKNTNSLSMVTGQREIENEIRRLNTTTGLFSYGAKQKAKNIQKALIVAVSIKPSEDLRFDKDIQSALNQHRLCSFFGRAKAFLNVEKSMNKNQKANCFL